MLGHLELWVLGLLAVVAGLVMLSNFFRVPYPVFLVLGGSPWASFPGCPSSAVASPPASMDNPKTVKGTTPRSAPRRTSASGASF